MHIPKQYFHDRLVLLLLSVNTFLAVLGSLLIFLKLDSARTTYTVQIRTNLGRLGGFKSGTATVFIGFVVFFIFVLVFHFILSARMYTQRKHFAITVLGMATLLLILGILVSNALLIQQ